MRKQSKPVALTLPLTLSLTGLPGAEAIEAAARGREGRLVLAEQPEEVLERQPTPLDAHLGLGFGLGLGLGLGSGCGCHVWARRTS